MLTRTLERRTRRVVAALAVFAGMTGLANAQQGGLFPLHPIKRQRVACPNEDPIYGTYRNQYYGYYPTQWKPFPQGWNLAGPETPNAAAEFQQHPLAAVSEPPAEGDKPDREAPDAGDKPAVPEPPTDTKSPFEMDPAEGSTAPRRPSTSAPARTPTPGTVNTPPAAPTTPRPTPGTVNSPFETPADKPPAAKPPAAGPATPRAPELGVPEAPRASRSTRGDRDVEALPARVASRGPLLESADVTLPEVEEVGQAGDGAVLGGPGASAPVAAQPAPAAPRRGRLSALFNGGWNLLRR
ncbi:hypothetical protein [Aquisphaera insulae]|uniref:hypothetical protein n=1 Tax=Aquisphaera insulae TaxID=2712864 RepID=UPI0013ECB032|nr:hypothetical protein [Aquisphaera insulae]